MTRQLLRLATCILTVAFLTMATLTTCLSASEPVRVQTASGRVFVGRVDIRSNEERLWLRFHLGATTVWRPVAWSRVVSVTEKGKQLEKDEVLDRATKAPARPERHEAAVAPKGETMADAARRTLEPTEPVRSIAFTARLGNWDADAAADGLIVDLETLAFDGSLVPVDGSVEITFYATRYRTPHSGATRNGREVRELGRWTRTFTAEEMSRGVRFELPFGAGNPESDRRWAPYGLVSVRVVVPGHGVFTDSHDFVRTRPASPTRDRHERVTGSRFFHSESLGR